jgi:hypothetical protein
MEEGGDEGGLSDGVVADDGDVSELRCGEWFHGRGLYEGEVPFTVGRAVLGIVVGAAPAAAPSEATDAADVPS